MIASDRLALLGDAAHAMAPNMGQGTNSAIVDAAGLAIELAGADRVTSALVNPQRSPPSSLAA